ncbi:pt repeat family protein [Stagonosporopsis vannaccii]|nr:pt repeat family protein [Stagonosporopsis vannaccii]
MRIISRQNRQRLRSLWTLSKCPPSTTDDIPPKADPVSESVEFHQRLIPLEDNPLRPELSSSPNLSVNATMQSEATITFTQPGVQPPVYVVTSLSTPPWAPLELKPSEEKTLSGDFIFERKFANITEGSYQYKIRIGEGHWVVDESQETATDEHGNRNNVLHVQPAHSHTPFDRTANTKDILDRKDSTLDTNDVGPAPVPFVVVEKVEDKAQPEYGDVQSKSLRVDEAKRAADPEPDVEKTKTDSPLNVESLQSTGELDELEPPDAQAPLFRHESFQDSAQSLPEHAMNVIDEESAHSSTDHTSSGDDINTPSAESQEDLQGSDELGHGSRLSHETGPGAEDTDEEDDIFQGPLLSHEAGFTPDTKQQHDDYEEDDFDAAPLLPHECGYSSYKSSEAASKEGRLSMDEYHYNPEHYTHYSGRSDEGEGFGELDLAPTFSHEQNLPAEDHGEPLLPHERGTASESRSGSERSFSMSPTTFEAPSFQNMDKHREFFGGSARHAFFRSRTSSSNLPNKLPRSDAEDTNLHDAGLEMFPVSREQILERVATIGHKLPEDETHGAPASPQIAREKDPLATPHPDDGKQLGYISEDDSKAQNIEPKKFGENSNASKTQGVTDNPRGLRDLSDIVASRATVKNTLTPPLTPRTHEALDKENSSPVPDSDLRSRRGPTEKSAESSTPTPRLANVTDAEGSSTDSSAVKSALDNLASEQSSTLNWKGASIGVSTLVAVSAVFYYLAVLR